ncbi:uncharacterized protein [Musca autumnalis]|uniref:uncharacterized protein n=1 Tax=Musca autumnalis TaxID=221902 RepID=UPI003CED82FC
MEFAAQQIAAIEILRELYVLEQNTGSKRRETNRKCWVNPLLIRRTEHDLEAHLLHDLLWDNDERDFKNFTRISVDRFEEILSLIIDRIKKKDTKLRDAITPRTKLAITLRSQQNVRCQRCYSRMGASEMEYPKHVIFTNSMEWHFQQFFGMASIPIHCLFSLL